MVRDQAVGAGPPSPRQILMTRPGATNWGRLLPGRDPAGVDDAPECRGESKYKHDAGADVGVVGYVGVGFDHDQHHNADDDEDKAERGEPVFDNRWILRPHTGSDAPPHSCLVWFSPPLQPRRSVNPVDPTTASMRSVIVSRRSGRATGRRSGRARPGLPRSWSCVIHQAQKQRNVVTSSGKPIAKGCVLRAGSCAFVDKYV